MLTRSSQPPPVIPKTTSRLGPGSKLQACVIRLQPTLPKENWGTTRSWLCSCRSCSCWSCSCRQMGKGPGTVKPGNPALQSYCSPSTWSCSTRPWCQQLLSQLQLERLHSNHT